MNRDVIQGKWQQWKGRVKRQWAKLTDDDLKQIEGNLDVATGKLQERYGYARDQAEREWDEFCRRCASEDRASEA